MISIRISNLSKEDQSHYSKQNQEEGEEGGILSAPELRRRSAPALWMSGRWGSRFSGVHTPGLTSGPQVLRPLFSG